MNKQLFLLIVILFITPLHAKTSDPYIKLIFHAIDKCYDSRHKIDVEFSACIFNHVKNKGNPNQYRININDDDFPRLIITIYNQKGLYIRCQAQAKDKIVVTACQDRSKAPLNDNQILSITPPQ
jgi:hypothetical protein